MRSVQVLADKKPRARAAAGFRCAGAMGVGGRRKCGGGRDMGGRGQVLSAGCGGEAVEGETCCSGWARRGTLVPEWLR